MPEIKMFPFRKGPFLEVAGMEENIQEVTKSYLPVKMTENIQRVASPFKRQLAQSF